MRVQQKVLCRLLAAVCFLAAALNLSAQGTAISYQGRLNDSGAPANTNYDFRFAVFTAPTNGAQVSVSVTNLAVPVSNGLFSVILDFGPGVFNGTANGSNDWLDIGVRAIGATSFTALVPRQPILPVPYALFATSASNLLGTVPSTLISGGYSNVVSFSNFTNTFAGTFAGNGASLSNLNASQITSGTVADARLSANVALLNGNQTFTGTNTFTNSDFFTGPNSFTGSNSFSGTNLFSGPITFKGTNFFSGVNTFTNNGNYFQGSFFGNGLVGWIPVYGAATNAMRDAGYLTLNPGLCSVTLPASASLLVGDIVRVSGGGGGWLVSENTGQSIIGNFAKYTNGILVALPGPTVNGYDIAASADGIRMYAVGSDITGVYASSDSGHTWGQVSGTQLSGDWVSVACSADGRTVYAEPYPTGTIVKSINGGLTWTSTGQGGNGAFIACTANGSTFFTGGIACSGNGAYQARLASGVINISTNSGSTWNSIPAAPASFNSLAASSDCSKLVAGVNGGLLYASSNQGATWTELTTTNLYLTGAWMSSDGSKLAASAITSGVIGGGFFSLSATALPNTISTNSTICGSQGSAVELQYIGNNEFIPASSTGLIWAN